MFKYLKKILIILTIPYLLWHLYGDALEYKNFYTYEEFKELELYGEGIISRGYYTHDRWGNRCHDYERGIWINASNLYERLPFLYLWYLKRRVDAVLKKDTHYFSNTLCIMASLS